MPKPFSISLSISVLPSIRRDKSFKSSSRPARLILAVLGGFVLMGLWLFVIARAQSSAQAAPAFQPCNAGPMVIARTHSSTGTCHNGVITAASDPLCIKTDLRVAKTVNNATPQVGDAITYTVVVINGGPDDATGVQLTDVLPKSVTFGSVTPQDSCTETDGTVICDLGSLPNDATARVTIVVTPTNAGMITNMTSVTGNESDPDPGNNTAEKSVRVVGADLVVTKTVNTTTPDAGEIITYTITVANDGPDNATGVQLTDTLPAGVTFNGYTVTVGAYSSLTGLWNVGNLASTMDAILIITATVDDCTNGRTITNVVHSLTSDQPDENSNNNRASAIITVTYNTPCLIYLPLILHHYRPLSNGDFETGDLTGWFRGRGAFQGHGHGLPQDVVWDQGSYRALLGDRSAQDGYIPVGYSSIAQTLTVERRYLQIHYRVLTYDGIKGIEMPDKYFDTFEVSIDTEPDHIDDDERDTRGCATTILNPTNTTLILTSGLVFCGGYYGEDIRTLHDLGWRTVALDLQNFQGRNITLYFALWSREYNPLYWNDEGYYNTWVYIDDVQLADIPLVTSALALDNQGLSASDASDTKPTKAMKEMILPLR